MNNNQNMNNLKIQCNNKIKRIRSHHNYIVYYMERRNNNKSINNFKRKYKIYKNV